MRTPKELYPRDTQRRLLRTTGQKGQTHRALQRTGAWELLPRSPTEAECLATLRQVSPTQLAKKQQRLRQHRERFRLYTRSIQRTNAQLLNSTNSASNGWLSQLRQQGDFCAIALKSNNRRKRLTCHCAQSFHRPVTGASGVARPLMVPVLLLFSSPGKL